MTGWEQTAVWLFGIPCAAATASSAVKAIAQARVEVARHAARATVEANRVVAEVRGGVVFPPVAWRAEEGL